MVNREGGWNVAKLSVYLKGGGYTKGEGGTYRGRVICSKVEGGKQRERMVYRGRRYSVMGFYLPLSIWFFPSIYHPIPQCKTLIICLYYSPLSIYQHFFPSYTNMFIYIQPSPSIHITLPLFVYPSSSKYKPLPPYIVLSISILLFPIYNPLRLLFSYYFFIISAFDKIFTMITTSDF